MQGYPYRRVAAASILRAFSNQKGARIMPNPTTLRNLSGLPAAAPPRWPNLPWC